MFCSVLSRAEVKHWVRVAPLLLGIPALLQQHHDDDPTREREWYRRVWSETTLSTKTPSSVSVCDIGIWKRGLIWGARRYFLRFLRQIWAPYIFHESQTGYSNRALVLLLIYLLPQSDLLPKMLLKYEAECEVCVRSCERKSAACLPARPWDYASTLLCSLNERTDGDDE